MKILFEPWSLGDAMIAASALRENLDEFALACHPRWHSLIRNAMGSPSNLKLLPIELDYATLKNANEYSWIKKILTLSKAPIVLTGNTRQTTIEVYSIRGDFRDYLAARSLFPDAKIKVSGWSSFLARRSPIVNFLFKSGGVQVKNRYAAWAEILGFPFFKTIQTYRKKKLEIEKINSEQLIGIHIGAQWGSRQYPFVARLKKLLLDSGFNVQIVAGSSDLLPDDVKEHEVLRLMGNDLIEKLKEFSFLIVNDSGPMHLSAFLGVHTFCVARISNIREWIPPAVDYISAEKMPTGYRADKYYKSDKKLSDWPSARDVFSRVLPKVLKFKNSSSEVGASVYTVNGSMQRILKKPKISVLIPVYNREKLIGPCIESALAQTNYDLEVVVSDNASTDNTYKVCMEYAEKDHRVHVYRSEKNLGPVANWKNCIDHAQGEYGKILFSDDCMHPLFLEKTIQFFNDPSIGFVFSAVKIGPEITQSRLWYPWKYKTGIYSSENFISSLYEGQPVPVSPGCALFRINELKSNLVSSVYTIHEVDFMGHGAGTDVLFYLLSAFKYKKVGFIADALTFFRSHDGSITKSNRDGSVKKAYNHALTWFSLQRLQGRHLTKLLARLWLEEILIHRGYVSPAFAWNNYISMHIILLKKIKTVFLFFLYISKRFKQHYF